jgi:hypothetical protein
LSRLATSFVLGYHGCDAITAENAITGRIDLLASDQPHDWLGPGIYFWESDPRRAFEWSSKKARAGRIATPAVIGAIIDLRNCLDLISREDILLLAAAYMSFEARQADAGLEMPVNLPAKGLPDSDKPRRFLDRAVINHLHTMIAAKQEEPFDTVRGMFAEGEEVYPGSGFRQQSHVQIAVRNKACILGIFLPRPHPVNP